MTGREPISVTELNARIKALIESDALLGSVCVRGELSNYKVYPSGHHYFTLKDAESGLRCVMFRSAASKLRFRPESGMGPRLGLSEGRGLPALLRGPHARGRGRSAGGL